MFTARKPAHLKLLKDPAGSMEESHRSGNRRAQKAAGRKAPRLLCKIAWLVQTLATVFPSSSALSYLGCHFSGDAQFTNAAFFYT
jgi:hypothetical protein